MVDSWLGRAIVIVIAIFSVSSCKERIEKNILVERYREYCASSIELKPKYYDVGSLQLFLADVVSSADDDLLRVVKIVRNQLDMCGRFGVAVRFEHRSGKYEYLTVYYDVGRDNIENKVEFAFVFEEGKWLIAQTKLFGPPNYP